MKRVQTWCRPLTALLVLSAVGCGTNTETKTVTEVQTVDTTPDCAPASPYGKCKNAGEVCFQGACVAEATLCSPTNLAGTCPSGQTCYAGGCVLASAFCSATNKTGICADADKTCFGGTCVASATLCSMTNATGTCPAGETCFGGGCVPNGALCSATNPTGPCLTGSTCFGGECVLTASLCSSTNKTGTCEAGKVCQDGICTVPGVDPCTVHVYTTQPTVTARTTVTASATGTLTLNGVLPGNTVNIGYCTPTYPCATGVTFTGVALNPTDTQFAVAGTDDAATAANLAAAINANATTSTLVTATANDKVVTLTAKAAGAAGNGIGMSGTASKFTATNSGVLAGGKGTGKNVITVDGLQFKDLNGNGTLDTYEDWRLSEICRAKDLVSKMTVPQKVGLMSEGGALGNGNVDGSIAANVRDNIVRLNMRQGLTRWGATAAQTAVYTNNVQELSESQPLGIPSVYTADPSHGLVQSTDATGKVTIGANIMSGWPLPLGLGAANDGALSKKYGDTVRKEFMAMGVRWQLGPMADSATEPRWARVQNTFGEGMSVAKNAAACIQGFQGSPNGDLHNGIAATAKHFPSAGPDEQGMDSHSRPGMYNVFPGNNFNYHLVPFQAAFDVNVAAIMPCYSIYKGIYEWDPEQVPTSFSYTMITKLAKEKMGFKGMVTGDWGNMGHYYSGIAGMTNPEKAALWLHAGSDQLGSDSQSSFQDAFDQGLVTEEDINRAASKILEMSFKLGIFENPYVDETPATVTAIVRGSQTSQDGFIAQKRAIVMLRNTGSRLPIDGTRFTDTNKNGVPDANETFVDDINNDGTIKVYFAGALPTQSGKTYTSNGLTGSDPLSEFLGDYDYTSAGGTNAKPVQSVSSIGADTDIAVIRITARKGNYSGLDAGVPLSFDAPFPGVGNDSGLTPATKDRNKIIDAFRIRDGYTKSDGTVVAPVNANLKIVVVMHFDRPGIIKPFYFGLKTLDEIAGQPGSYPLVSNEANVNQTNVTTTSATAHAGVDAFLVDFGAYDRAVLDFLFNKNLPDGVTKYGLARLPMEIPFSDAEVAAQFEDVPADTHNPTNGLGTGSNY